MNIRISAFEKMNLTKTAIYLVYFGILDALFTDIGIRFSYIEEANPIMQFVYENGILLFYFIKIGLPLGLVYVSTKIESKRYVQLFALSAVVLYLVVLLLHLYWIVVVLTV